MIQEDGQLDGGHQHGRNRNGFERPRHNQEDAGDGQVVSHYEVHSRGVDQVPVHGALAGNHGVFIVLMQDGVHLIQLIGHRVSCGRIAGVHHHQLVAPLLEHILHRVGDEEVGDAGAQHFVVGHHGGNALDRLHAVLDVAHLRRVQVVPQDDEVGGGHIEVVFQLLVGDDGGQVPGQGFIQLVVDPGVGLGVIGGDKQHNKDHHNGLVVPQNEAVHLIKAGHQALVLVLGDLLVEDQHQGGQHQNNGGHAQHNAFGHDDADVPAQSQPHDAQGQEARHRGQAGGGQGPESRHNGLGHGIPVIVVIGPLLLVPVVEEDGVVHGNAQLQNGGDSLGDVRDLS